MDGQAFPGRRPESNPDEMTEGQIFNQRPTVRVLPSEDFDFQVFLQKIADEITPDDLKKLKFYCAGDGCLGKAVLERINDALDLFRHMKELRLLSPANLATLQAMLWHIRRKDLYKKFVEFCRSRDKTLHFQASSDNPVNGFTSVDFHIKGIQNFNKESLRRLQEELSVLLCCPPHHILIDGIQPSNSLQITIIIPNDHIEFLESIGDHEKEMLHFHGVDCFKINGLTITCREFKTEEHIPELERDEEVKRILRKCNQLEHDLQHYQLVFQNTLESYNETKVALNEAIDGQRDLKYAKDLSEEEVRRLRRTLEEYKIACLHFTEEQSQTEREITYFYEPYQHSRPGVGLIKLQRHLSQADIEELRDLSCAYQSEVINILASSTACETTSFIMETLNKNKHNVDDLKRQINQIVPSNLFDKLFPIVLNLKTIEDAIKDRDTQTDIYSCLFSSDNEDDVSFKHDDTTYMPF